MLSLGTGGEGLSQYTRLDKKYECTQFSFAFYLPACTDAAIVCGSGSCVSFEAAPASISGVSGSKGPKHAASVPVPYLTDLCE